MLAEYAAIIRAYKLTPLLEQLIKNLRAQSMPPKDIIVVDSSLTDELSSLDASIVKYPSEEFNFSKAINIGVECNIFEYSLIISSHMMFSELSLIERGYNEMLSNRLAVGYWCQPSPRQRDSKSILIDRGNFDGRNGLSNSMAFIPTRFVKERPFREEVFSAEDQEWASRFFKEVRGTILRMESIDVRYENPNHTEGNWSEAKELNEYISLGHFVRRRMIFPDKIAGRFFRGLLAAMRRRPKRARIHFNMAWRMTKANFVRPTAASRYF